MIGIEKMNGIRLLLLIGEMVIIGIGRAALKLVRCCCQWLESSKEIMPQLKILIGIVISEMIMVM